MAVSFGNPAGKYMNRPPRLPAKFDKIRIGHTIRIDRKGDSIQGTVCRVPNSEARSSVVPTIEIVQESPHRRTFATEAEVLSGRVACLRLSHLQESIKQIPEQAMQV